MKDFNIFGVYWKILFLEGEFTKNQYMGGLPKEGGGLGQFADLRGAWHERGGWCFWGRVDTPMHTMQDKNVYKFHQLNYDTNL